MDNNVRNFIEDLIQLLEKHDASISLEVSYPYNVNRIKVKDVTVDFKGYELSPISADNLTSMLKKGI